MTGSDEAPEPAVRRRPGLPWLIGLVVIPLLLAVIGSGGLDRSRSPVNGPTGALPTLSVPSPHARAPTIPAVSASPCTDLSTDIEASGPITFPTDGFTLTPADEQTLNHIADRLKACPGAKVTINGYTDNTGSDAINVPLSAGRAAAVADYLIAQGVTGDRLTAKGFGSAAPVADNGAPDGQAKNRRVEIRLS